MESKNNRVILALSLPLSALVIAVSCIGLLTPGFYAAETMNWQAQSTGQDIIDLFLVTPCLLISAALAARSNKIAEVIWAGVILYLTYTFVIYCFDIHFNKLFVVYCLCLGLSSYSFIYYMYSNLVGGGKAFSDNRLLTRIIAIFFLFISVMFYFLWLSEIVPALLRGDTPKSIIDTGLFTNGVHVLDLALFLPGIFITGIFLLKRSVLGFVYAPVILTFFVLMDITIGFLAFFMKMKGVSSDLSIVAIMGVFTVVSLGLLIGYSRNINANNK